MPVSVQRGAAVPMTQATGDGGPSSARARIDVLDVHSIADTAREPLLVLDGHLRVQSANRTFRV